jgi:hypothetical protein
VLVGGTRHPERDLRETVLERDGQRRPVRAHRFRGEDPPDPELGMCFGDGRLEGVVEHPATVLGSRRAVREKAADQLVLERGRAVGRMRIGERVVRDAAPLEQLHTDKAVLAAAAQQQEPPGRVDHHGRSAAVLAQPSSRSRQAVVRKVVLVPPHAPNVVEQRFPELPERLGDEVGVGPEVDRIGRQAGRLVRLEREQVKLDPAQEPLAVDRRQPLQVNVVVPVRRAETELVDAVAQKEVTTAAANRLEPQRRHPPSLLPCRSSPRPGPTGTLKDQAQARPPRVA